VCFCICLSDTVRSGSTVNVRCRHATNLVASSERGQDLSTKHCQSQTAKRPGLGKSDAAKDAGESEDSHHD
jgi:hypothetical protein